MLKERKDIEGKFKWDLSSLYVNDESWENDFTTASSLFESIENFKGHVLDTKENLLKVLESIEKVDRLISNLSTYAKMKQDENTKDSHYQSLFARAQTLIGSYREVTSFFVPELISGDPKLIETYLNTPELKLYDQHIHNILRARPHTLSQESETILAKASELMAAPSNAYGMLSAADLKFPSMENEKGEVFELTHGNFVPTLMSKNRKVREEAFKKYYSIFDGHKNVFASLLNSEVKKNIFYAKSKGFASARAAALFENNVPESVYDQLISAVHESLDSLHEYIGLRKELLGVDSLKPYDLYVPLIEDVDMSYPYEEAQGHVLKSLEILGKDYTEVVENSFTDGWIDVYENVGKRSGAYSWGTYDSKPYILLNYHDQLNDMFTLTHEMGHSMHSYYSRENQPYVYGNYSIFVAEVASTTNEALLNKYLLNNVKDKKEKLYLLNNYLENFRGTVFRQTMFAEFEKMIHDKVEKGEALTADVFNTLYHDLNVKYYGPALDIDSELDLEWARIPHFYYNFYVFQYATGFSAAESLADRMVNDPKSAVNAYKGFLSAGCSNYPIEVLKLAGVDMTTPQPVENALKVFRNLVKEMKELLKDA
ncbi:MAG: oligoendopeptidase F [Clostridia bacterium]|nr:oligoendopeptidase F [Clostridia bacterium]